MWSRAARWWTRGAEWWWPGVAVAIPSLALIGLLVFYRGGGFLAWPFMFAAGFLAFKAVEVLRIEGTERGYLVAIITAITVYVAVVQILVPATRSYFPAATLVAAAEPRPWAAPTPRSRRWAITNRAWCSSAVPMSRSPMSPARCSSCATAPAAWRSSTAG